MKSRISAILFLFVVFAAYVSANYAEAATRSLYLGHTGNDVVSLQKNLIATGYLADRYATGYFGPLTDSALKKFQCDKDIICSGTRSDGYGVYGPRTQATMTTALSASRQSATLTGNPLTGPATGAFEFSGWIPYWRAATGTADTLLHLNQLASVMPFAYSVKSDGTLADTARLGQEPWKSFIAVAKIMGVRVVPTVMWGNGARIHEILSDTKKRIALEDEITALVKTNDFDGIDIDFEAKRHETINYFSTFLKGLYQRMGKKWVYCTIEARMPLENRYSPGANIPPDARDYANDYVEMNKYCDRVEIMAYDQGTIDLTLNRKRKAPYAPTADLEWVESLVTLASQNISKNKLVLGIPTYGYEYKVTPVSGGRYEYKVLWPFNPGYAVEIAQKVGITPTRNEAGELGFTYDSKLLDGTAPSENQSTQTQQTIASSSVAENADLQEASAGTPFNYLSWSDAKSVEDRVALARRLGIRGVALFKFDGGEDPNIWGVLR